MDNIYHTPVMPEEAVGFLNLRENSVAVDATCGEGGHSLLIARLIPGKAYLHRQERTYSRTGKTAPFRVWERLIP